MRVVQFRSINFQTMSAQLAVLGRLVVRQTFFRASAGLLPVEFDRHRLLNLAQKADDLLSVSGVRRAAWRGATASASSGVACTAGSSLASVVRLG